MSATKINETKEIEWTRYRGDSFQIYITVKNETTKEPIDITDATIRFLVGTIDEETLGVVTTNGGALGTIDIFIPSSVMDDLDIGDYNVAVELYYADDDIRNTICTGKLILEDDFHV
jgi:archaellin